eukprot:gene3589-6324_t
MTDEEKIVSIVDKPKLNIDEFIGLTGVKKGRVLFNFEAIGKNEISVKEDDVIDIIEDLEGKDSGWTLIMLQNKKGIIPTKYYQILTQLFSPRSPRISENCWKFRIKLVRIEYLSGKSTGPILLTWTTKRKMGSSGSFQIEDKQKLLPIYKSYDIVEQFMLDSSSTDPENKFKPKYVRLFIRDDDKDFELERVLMNDLISSEKKKNSEITVKCNWREEHPNAKLVLQFTTNPTESW